LAVSGKPGRSGRPKGSTSAHVEERQALIIAYYLAGHSVRETALVFRLHTSRVGKIVKASARSKSEAKQLLDHRRSQAKQQQELGDAWPG
jgi:transposase